MGISLLEHLLHNRRPQCRLEQTQTEIQIQKLRRALVPNNKDLRNSEIPHQWCFLFVIPNLLEHSWQTSPSPHFGSQLRKSSSRNNSCLEATWKKNGGKWVHWQKSKNALPWNCILLTKIVVKLKVLVSNSLVGSTLYTTFRVLYSPLYQAAMQAYLLSTIEEKSWAQMNKNTLFLV